MREERLWEAEQHRQPSYLKETGLGNWRRHCQRRRDPGQQSAYDTPQTDLPLVVEEAGELTERTWPDLTFSALFPVARC